MTDRIPVASQGQRAQLAMDKLMDAAVRLYAEHGFAGVSIRQICDAAGQRNNSVVQYHFRNRDGLIKAIVARHLGSVHRYRNAMTAALANKPETTRRDRIACLVLPYMMHGIDLGTPSWHARFVAQVLVEPSLREYVLQSGLAKDSLRLLGELPGASPPDPAGEPVRELAAMVRQLVVHSCADIEYDLARGRMSASDVERTWRRLGERLVTAVCGMSMALLGPDERPVR
ncbi:MAG TPA: helix-turn-helix domain-containing protein [Pseudonocardiaceae bacterium]